jgi:hypothetical protein
MKMIIINNKTKEGDDMPYGDRTGPLGYGSMTGRGAGYCTGNGAPGYRQTAYGRGRAFGCGGRGWRNMYYAAGVPGWGGPYAAGSIWPGYDRPPLYENFSPETEMQSLKNQTDFFRKQIDVLNDRIAELQGIAAGKREDKD